MDNNKLKKVGAQALVVASAVPGLMGSIHVHVTPEMIVKAWKSPKFFATLTPEQQKLIPTNPAGYSKSEDKFALADSTVGNSCTVSNCTVGNSCTASNSCTVSSCDTLSACTAAASCT